MSKYICPYEDASSKKYVDFCLIVVAMIIFMIVFIVIFLLFAIHQVVAYIILFSATFVFMCLYVMVIINLDPSRLYEEEQNTIGLGETNQGNFRCIHAVVIYFVIVSFIFLAYCIYVGIDVTYRIDTMDNTTSYIIVNGFGSGGFILLIIIMCIFSSCRWCTNVGRFRYSNENFGEDDPFLSTQEYPNTNPSAPSYT